MRNKTDSASVFIVMALLAITWLAASAWAGPPQVELEYYSHHGTVMTDKVSPGMELCLVNQEDEDVDLMYDGDEYTDEIVVSFAWGEGDRDLTADPEAMTCSPVDPGWVCEGPILNGPDAMVMLRPDGTVTVGPGAASCFVLEDVSVNAAEGPVTFWFDQQIGEARAKEPLNQYDEVFKTVVGNDADTLDGLDSEDLDQRDDVAELQQQVADLQDQIADLQSQFADLQADVVALQDLLQGFSRSGTDLFVDGSNVYIRNGTGSISNLNGVGNLIIGYGNDVGSGSHNLVVGYSNDFDSYGGIVAGYNSRINGPYATITGGYYNYAYGSYSHVGGGYYNTASGAYSAVHGGYYNRATGSAASVLGGYRAYASGSRATVSGGYYNSATTSYAAVAGGVYNTASGSYSAVAGGYNNKATGSFSAVSGGYTNTATGSRATVSGGYNNRATGTYATVSGGYNRSATGTYNWRGGSYSSSN